MNSIDSIDVFQNFSDALEEFDLMEKSFQSIARSLSKVVHQKSLKENEKAFCENLVNKSKGQAMASDKLKKRLQVIYSDSSNHFLAEKISKLENKMNDLGV